MTTTTICTTCGRCHLAYEVASTSLLLALPAPAGDTGAEPSFVARCPSCGGCGSTSIPWRTATYLLHAGSTTITAPDPGRISPTYPEHRPTSTSPMTLDDLIDLRALLDTDARPSQKGEDPWIPGPPWRSAARSCASCGATPPATASPSP